MRVTSGITTVMPGLFYWINFFQFVEWQCLLVVLYMQGISIPFLFFIWIMAS